jgi:hypothetical protein
LEDIEFLSERLHASVQDLSSFDEYCTEIRSGRLQWSPVHKSEKFWRENAQRFNEKNFELIKSIKRGGAGSFQVAFQDAHQTAGFQWRPVGALRGRTRHWRVCATLSAREDVDQSSI